MSTTLLNLVNIQFKKITENKITLKKLELGQILVGYIKYLS